MRRVSLMFIARLQSEVGYGVSVPASSITSCGGEAQFGVCDRLTIYTCHIELEQEVFDRADVSYTYKVMAKSWYNACKTLCKQLTVTLRTMKVTIPDLRPP